jgi:hypothetical protein
MPGRLASGWIGFGLEAAVALAKIVEKRDDSQTVFLGRTQRSKARKQGLF